MPSLSALVYPIEVCAVLSCRTYDALHRFRMVMVIVCACRFPCFQPKLRFTKYGPSLSEANKREADEAGEQSRSGARTLPEKRISPSAIAAGDINTPDLKDAAHAHLARCQLSAPDRCNVHSCDCQWTVQSRARCSTSTEEVVASPCC